jgi:hypothetical protein
MTENKDKAAYIVGECGMTGNNERSYQFSEGPDFFEISGRDRPKVRVELHRTCLRAGRVGEYLGRGGFYCYRALVKFLAEGLLRTWQPPADRPVPMWPIKDWVIDRAAKAIGKRVHVQWKRLLAKADPEILAVHRAIFAATLGWAKLALDEELYKHPFLVRDIINYRAAAVAVSDADELMSSDFRERLLNSSPEAEALRRKADELGLKLSPCIGAGRTRETEPLDDLHNWQALFSSTGQPYRSLSKTLMSLPPISHRAVCWLNEVKLDRPVTDGLELLALILSATKRICQTPRHVHIFQHATSGEIREAIRRVAAHTHNNLSPRRMIDLGFVVRFLNDFPDSHNGRLLGLTHKAIRWHRDKQRGEIDRVLAEHPASELLASPPIALPAQPEIRFLGTVGAVCEEAERMKHCVANYVSNALRGGCFLFHVSINGQEATAQVSQNGHVQQSAGPGNERNQAAAWARRALRRWANGFPSVPSLPDRLFHAAPDEAAMRF